MNKLLEKMCTKIEEIKTYLGYLFDEMVYSTVSKDLPLRSLVVKQYVKSCILVRSCPLVESTTKIKNEVRLCSKQTQVAEV